GQLDGRRVRIDLSHAFEHKDRQLEVVEHAGQKRRVAFQSLFGFFLGSGGCAMNVGASGPPIIVSAVSSDIPGGNTGLAGALKFPSIVTKASASWPGSGPSTTSAIVM